MEEIEIEKIYPVKSTKGSAVPMEQQFDWVKSFIEELLQKMTITVLNIELKSSSNNKNKIFKESTFDESLGALGQNSSEASKTIENKNSLDVNITIKEPQILIGQSGQTLFELQRLLGIILHKKLSRSNKESATESGQKDFYLNLDINDYKKKKIEYLKDLAITLANEAIKTQEKKILPPMPSYERRIIHTELSLRQDVVTESQGEGIDRCVVIKPK